MPAGLMRRSIGQAFLAASLVTCLSAAAAAGDKAPSLEGNWKATSVHCSGEVCEAARGLECRISKDRIAARYGDNTVEVGFVLDAAKEPKVIGITKGGLRIWEGIYRLDADTLTICVATPGAKPPTELQTKAGDGRVLVRLDRVKTPER